MARSGFPPTWQALNPGIPPPLPEPDLFPGYGLPAGADLSERFANDDVKSADSVPLSLHKCPSWNRSRDSPERNADLHQLRLLQPEHNSLRDGVELQHSEGADGKHC